MKLFCAYAFTSEDLEVVTNRMKLVADTLNDSGHEVYCNLFDPIVEELYKKNDIKAIFQTAFQHLKRSDAVVVVITSPSKSTGQIMEMGVALQLKKPIYLFEHKSSAGSTYLPQIADKHFVWETEDQLREALGQVQMVQ